MTDSTSGDFGVYIRSLFWTYNKMKGGLNMIETCVQRGSSVYVYGSGNHLLFTKSGELHGFTSNTVSIKSGSRVSTYDAKGRLISVH